MDARENLDQRSMVDKIKQVQFITNYYNPGLEGLYESTLPNWVLF